MLIALVLATLSSTPQTRPVRVERSRDTAPSVGEGVSTTLDTNGWGNEQTPVDAERAFAADAKTIGQWTAFRKWSTDDAVMFVPQPTNAHEFLKDRKDPPKAIDWWPTASWISCDGSLAVNTGGWKRPDGSVGYFSTVWQRQKDGGWKWIVDRGDSLETPRSVPAKPPILKATCPKSPISIREVGYRSGGGKDGASPDGSLQYHWWADGPGHSGLTIEVWDGSRFATVISDVSRNK